MRWAWSEDHYGISVNAKQTIASPSGGSSSIFASDGEIQSTVSRGIIVWKLVVVEDVDGVIIKEFRRVNPG